MSFLDNLYDAIFNATVDDYKEAISEYACPIITGGLLTPLLFVTGGTGLVACYTVKTVGFGSLAGALGHYNDNGLEMIKGGIEAKVGIPNTIPNNIYKKTPIMPNPPIPAMRDRPMYKRI